MFPSHTYHKSAIKLPGGLFISRMVGGGGGEGGEGRGAYFFLAKCSRLS